ncbi:MrcB family domain-containing protein [Acinetobacter sp. ULE_I010]|uniref:MrcB family domain-containing protein n=1 Tax=Acinetobacter sp. ULE_I010 TaxID=3373065 RepID=UPI003AF61C3B
MKQNLLNILDHYLYAKQQPFSTNKQQNHYVSLSSVIISTLQTWIIKYSDPKLTYELSWSHGQGNWAEIPWILCTNKAITSSAQRGYYIGILFSADMSSCSMGILQGVTDAKPEDLISFSSLAIEYIGGNSEFKNLKLGCIDLKATSNLGKKYQKFAIKSFEYPKTLLGTIDDEFIEKQFKILLRDYETLYHNAQNDLSDLAPISNQSYQAIIQNNDDNSENLEVVEREEEIPETLATENSRYKRSKDKSRKALKLANFQCEIDSSHTTFLTKRNQFYAEGHHLIPMSQQSNFKVSLDVTSNIICLCPNCHTALHYGNNEIVKEKLNKLFQLRNERLKNQGIDLPFKEIQNMYIKVGLDQKYD